MKSLIAFGSIFLVFAMAMPVNADGNGELKKYFSNTASEVRATDNAFEKREILNESFQNMSQTLDKVLSSGLISENDRIGIEQFKTILQEKQNELEGSNGYERVPDAQLNAFANYVVQDMEQADTTITISVVVLLLIIILIVLLV
jgi:hypothetical protein